MKGFLILAKSAKGAACESLIKSVLDSPGVYVFGELLEMPNVQALAGTSVEPSLELLKIFAYGTWKDYKAAEARLPPLTEPQAIKLKRLTVVSLASASKQVAYDVLLRELEMTGVRELEDLLIECAYGGLVQGRFDQAAGQLHVFSCSSRDVHPDDLIAMSTTLLNWHGGAVELMASVSTQLASFKAQQDDARAAQADLDAKVEAVKVTLKTAHDAEGFGPMDSDNLRDFEGDEKMRKSGRLKARHPGSDPRKHNVPHR
uniref:PCI domain-containing protein n=1 Tax=Haptolina brevifila TaxID=156173 RepID=A0A7S2JF62_9EUKA